MCVQKLTRKEVMALSPEAKAEYQKAIASNRKKSYYRKNKDKIIAYSKSYYQSNRGSIAAKSVAKYQDSVTHYVVYSHTSLEGQVYIGSGTNLRPYIFDSVNRRRNWHKVFTKDTVKVEILHKFDTRDEAMIKESELIKSIGLENLVNTKA